MSDEIVHLLLMKKPQPKTACGMNIVAIYTPSWYCTTDEAGKPNIKVTVDKGVTCKQCKERMKE